MFIISLEKLTSHCMDGCTLSWVKNSLDSWAQRMVANGVDSNWRLVSSGSVFGPALFNIFMGEMDEGTKSMLRQFTDNTNLGRSVDLLKYRKTLQRDLDRLDWWKKANCMRFKKAKHHLGHNNSWQWPFSLVLHTGEVASWVLCSLLGLSLQEGAGTYLEKATELGKCLDHKTDVEQMRELEVFSLKKSRCLRQLLAFYNCPKGGCSNGGFSVSSQVKSYRTRGNGLTVCQSPTSQILRKVSSKEGLKHWNRLPRKVVATVSGSSQKTCCYSTWRPGLWTW